MSGSLQIPARLGCLSCSVAQEETEVGPVQEDTKANKITRIIPIKSEVKNDKKRKNNQQKKVLIAFKIVFYLP